MEARESRTRSSAPKLSDIARHVVVPRDVVSTGWPSVQAKCSELGITFRPWQPDVGRVILAKRADGKYAATVGGTGLSIPRQVGKTFLVGAIVFALCLLFPKLTVIWTAHRLRTAEETFGKMLAMSRRKKIAPHMLRPVLGAGEQAILFRNGSRILFGARERGFGRGFDSVDVLIFDEAQILTENALDDMVPAANQSKQPTSALQLYMGTPPKTALGQGEVFSRMRLEALSGDDEDTGWIEFGADPDFEPTPLPGHLKPADWEQIAKANPSYPDDTPREAILRMRKKLGSDSFLREGMGIWDDPTRKSDAFGRGNWDDCAGPMPEGLPMGAIGIASSMDLTHSAVVAAATEVTDAGELVHVKPLRHSPGTGWVVEWVADLQSRHDVDVVVDGRGPAAVLIPHLEKAGVRLHVASTTDVQDSFAAMQRLVVEGKRLRHEHYPELDAAVAVAARRPVLDRWAWGRKQSGADISPLEAASLAAWRAGVDLGPAVNESDYETTGVMSV